MSDSGYPQSEYSDSLRESSKSILNVQFSQKRGDVGENVSPPKDSEIYNKLKDFPGFKMSTSRSSSVVNTYLSSIQNGSEQLGQSRRMVSNKPERMQRPHSTAFIGFRCDESNLTPDRFSSNFPNSVSKDSFQQRRLSPSIFKKPQDNVADDSRKQAQMQAYIAWVNVQLKKKAGTRSIEDLSVDMQDGTALLNLIHIVAGDELEDVHMTPSSREQMIQNINQVIQFMRTRHIRMHHTSAADIVDGNTKAIMRLILALAAHFKPNSVKQSSQAVRTQTLVGIAQGAAAALADARKDANRTSQRPRRPKHLAKAERRHRSASNTDSDSDTQPGSHSSFPLSARLGVVDGASSVATSAVNSPRTSSLGSPHFRLGTSSNRAQNALFPKSKSVDFRDGADVSGEACKFSEEFVQDLTKEYGDLQTDMDHTKSSLLMLQDLLLSGRIPDGAESEARPAEGSTSGEELVILRSKLQHSEEVCKQLKQQVSSLRQETMQLQGVKAGLQQRLSEQEHSFLVMKAELLRAGFAQQALETAKGDLEKKIEEKDTVVLGLRKDLAKREREIDELKANFQVEQQQRDATARALRAQITDLHSKLQRVGETEATLSARVASQDRKMARLEGKILASHDGGGSTRGSSCRSTHSASSDDVQVVRDSLHNLRTHFHGNESQHQAIEALETSIATLMDRIQTCESRGSPGSDHSGSQFSSSQQRPRSRQYESLPSTPSKGLPGQHLDNPVNGNHSTKVLYFTDRTVTPFMCTLPKRLGEISLRDIKGIVEKPGLYRYHFKAMDPEFGTVKEEVLHDEDIVPGWEGKIVAWIEEDHG